MIEQKPLTIILSGEHKHLFKKWVNALLILNDSRDSYFRLKLLKTKDGLFVRQFNDSKITLVESLFNKKFFRKFTKETIDIEIDLKALVKCLNFMSKETDDLTIIFDLPNNELILKDDMTKATIDIANDLFIHKVPVLKLPDSIELLKCKVKSDALVSVLKTANKLSDVVIISQIKNAFLKFSTESDITFEQLLPVIPVGVMPEIKSCFNTDYLNDIKLVCPLDSFVSIECASYFPIIFTWYFGKNSYFKFFCSPRTDLG